MVMRHCIIMTAYKDVGAINRFVKFTPPYFNIYVHLDLRSKIIPAQIDGRARVYKKFSIHWGAVEHVDAILLLLKEAVTSGVHYDYYHIISGQDFYACPPTEFDERLGNGGINYIGIFPIPNKHWAWHQGYDIFRYRTLASVCDVRKIPARFINKGFCYLQRITRSCRELPDFQLFGGAVWCSLHNGFVQWLLNSDFAVSLLKRLRNSTCAEEVFFATCIKNSPYRDKVSDDNPLRYWNWHVEKPPKVLDFSDFQSIKDSGALFCRKIDSMKSRTLLPVLESYIVNQD